MNTESAVHVLVAAVDSAGWWRNLPTLLPLHKTNCVFLTKQEEDCHALTSTTPAIPIALEQYQNTNDINNINITYFALHAKFDYLCCVCLTSCLCHFHCHLQMIPDAVLSPTMQNMLIAMICVWMDWMSGQIKWTGEVFWGTMNQSVSDWRRALLEMLTHLKIARYHSEEGRVNPPLKVVCIHNVPSQALNESKNSFSHLRT